MTVLFRVLAALVPPALVFTCIVLFAVGFLNLAFGGYAAGSVLMALAVAGLVIPARARRGRHRG